ncbi:hypothetical protein ACRAWF_20880 [Streptomyces sp. L7]
MIGSSVGGWIAAEMALRDNLGPDRRPDPPERGRHPRTHGREPRSGPSLDGPDRHQPTLLRQGGVPPRLRLLHSGAAHRGAANQQTLGRVRRRTRLPTTRNSAPASTA